MKSKILILIGIMSSGAWTSSYLVAAEKQAEVTLKGKITCAKCELELTKRCASVIVVKEGDKEVIYYFDTAGNKQYHAETCSQARPGEVVGTVSEANGKKIITVKRVKFFN